MAPAALACKSVRLPVRGDAAPLSVAIGYVLIAYAADGALDGLVDRLDPCMPIDDLIRLRYRIPRMHMISLSLRLR